MNNPLNNATLDDLQVAFLESLTASSFEEFYQRIIKLKTLRSELTRITLKSVLKVVISFMGIEDALSGSLFLVCREWYHDLIDSEFVWNVLFERAIASSIEFGKNWEQSKPTQINNMDINMQLNEKSGHGSIPWLTQHKSDYSWQFKRAFCQAKYHSYSKHCKIGTIRPYLVSSFEHDFLLSTRDYEPNLNSVFHIVESERSGTNVNDTWIYSTAGTPDSVVVMKSKISFSMDYFNIAFPHQSFTMKVFVDLFTSEEISDKKCQCEITVSLLDSLKSFNYSDPESESSLVLVQVNEQGEEEPQERLNAENIETFRKLWLGDESELNLNYWISSFVEVFKISPLARAMQDIVYY